MKTFNIGAKSIGEDQPAYIIAEAGVNHNGSVEMARELVRRARQCGADCVKFQTFRAERVVTRGALKAAYQLKVTDPAESQIAMLRKLELSSDAHREVIELCRDQGIEFLSTPYSSEDAAFLNDIGTPAFKIASGQLVEIPLLEEIARYGKPMILSTGMATMEEVVEAVAAVRKAGNDRIAVLQCTTNYPSRIEDANLTAMESIRLRTSTVAGYSDHTEGIEMCLAAAALGARIIEKHFTLDRSLPGPDHRCSSEPAEIEALVRGVRKVELGLGDGIKQPTQAERANTIGMRRSIVSRHLIAKGQRVTAADFAFKRPGTGMEPKRLPELVGRPANREILPDTLVAPGFFDE